MNTEEYDRYTVGAEPLAIAQMYIGDMAQQIAENVVEARETRSAEEIARAIHEQAVYLLAEQVAQERSEIEAVRDWLEAETWTDDDPIQPATYHNDLGRFEDLADVRRQYERYGKN